MRRIKHASHIAWDLTWLIITCLPAFVGYVVTLGAAEIQIYNEHNFPVFMLPGWSRNEINWHIPAWAPLI
jgi:hypothetical protein